MIFCVTVSNCLIVNRGIVSPTPVHVNPTFIVNPCNFLGGLVDYGFSVLQLLSLIKWFFIQISIIHENISSQVVDRRRQGFGQWINSSIIHDNICRLIRKMCHVES